jgi:hypothetical protein
MKQGAFVAIAGLALAAGLNAAPASAQSNRTFVSGQGDDSNPCTNTFPCRSFAYAITQTNAGGEIATLDAAGYGRVTITKAISITNDGAGEAGISVGSAVAGITIAAGLFDVVNLRGLTLIGNAVGTDGIQFNTGRELNVQNCKISGFAGNGILAAPTGTSLFSISDTIASGNQRGIDIAPSGSGTVTAVFKRVEASGNVFEGFKVDGEFSTGTVSATIADSVAGNNDGRGIAVVSATGKAATTLVVIGSQAVNNTNGLVAEGANALMLVGQTTVSGNVAGWSAGGPGFGTLKSYNNNYVDGNGGSEAAMPLVSTK